MEGAEITLERLDYVLKARQQGRHGGAGVLRVPRRRRRARTSSPTSPTSTCSSKTCKWTIVAGIVNDSLVMSVRNLGYSRNAGEFVRKHFADIGSAGGHRAMAKAVVPLRAFQDKFGNLAGRRVHREGAGARARVPPRASGQEARQGLEPERARRLTAVTQRDTRAKSTSRKAAEDAEESKREQGLVRSVAGRDQPARGLESPGNWSTHAVPKIVRPDRKSTTAVPVPG